MNKKAWRMETGNTLVVSPREMGLHAVMCWPDHHSEEHPNAAPWLVGPFKTRDAAVEYANNGVESDGDNTAFVVMPLNAIP